MKSSRSVGAPYCSVITFSIIFGLFISVLEAVQCMSQFLSIGQAWSLPTMRMTFSFWGMFMPMPVSVLKP